MIKDWLLETFPSLRALGSLSRKRLTADIRWLRQRLEEHQKSSDQAEKDQAILATDFLDKAQDAIKVWDINGGWKCLNEAIRQEIYVLEGSEIEARQIALKNEAEEKLSGWRKKSVKEILTKAQKLTGGEDRKRRSLIVEAMEIRDSHYDNLFFRKELVRNRMAILSVVMTFLVGGFLILAWYDADDLLGAAEPPLRYLLLGSALLGGIAACLSALMSLSSKERIPDQFTSMWVTGARPLIGAASGLVAVFFSKAGIITIGDNTSAVMVLAFALGFSERLFMGTMKKIGSKDSKTKNGG